MTRLKVASALHRNWKRSRKGNLWQRQSDGTTATVFFRPWDDGWGFGIFWPDGDEPYFSSGTFATEREAAWYAARELAEERSAV